MPHTITTERAARDAGYTVPMVADGDYNTLDILVREGVDLDGRFRAYVSDWNETAVFNGWMWCFEALPALDMLEA